MSELAADLLQFAELFTASTGGTFNSSRAAGWTASVDICSWEYVACNDDILGPGIYLNLSSQRITGAEDCDIEVARLIMVPMSSTWPMMQHLLNADLAHIFTLHSDAGTGLQIAGAGCWDCTAMVSYNEVLTPQDTVQQT